MLLGGARVSPGAEKRLQAPMTADVPPESLGCGGAPLGVPKFHTSPVPFGAC